MSWGMLSIYQLVDKVICDHKTDDAYSGITSVESRTVKQRRNDNKCPGPYNPGPYNVPEEGRMNVILFLK